MNLNAKIIRAYYVFQAQGGYWYIDRLNDHRNVGVPSITFDVYSAVYDTEAKARAALQFAAAQTAAAPTHLAA